MHADPPLSLLSVELILETISEISLQVQQRKEIQDIVQRAIAQARIALQADRVFIYRALNPETIQVAFESVDPESVPLIGEVMEASSYTTWLEWEHQSKAAFNPLPVKSGADCCVQSIGTSQTQASLTAPIWNQNCLWGLLMVHDYCRPREWQLLETRYLQQVALQLGIAVQQAELQQAYQSLMAERVTAVETMPQHSPQSAITVQDCEHYYAQILDSVQDMVFCKAPGSIVIYANRAACNFYGMTLAELHGITDVPFNQLDFTQQYLRDDLQVFTTGKVLERLEEPNQRFDGNVHYFHTVKSPIFDAEGNVSQIVGVSRDITDRKQAEAQLRRYERIVSATADAFALIDRNYRYQMVNQACLNWNQKSSEEVVGHSAQEILGQAYFETVAKPCLDRCLSGELQQIVETWHDYPDGQRRYVRVTYTPYTELDGTISGVVVNIHDLTDLKRVEDALREQQRFTEQIAESILAILYVYDVIEQRNIYCNQQFKTILGYSLEELQNSGQGWLQQLVHPDDLPSVLTNQRRLLQGQDGEFVETEYRMRHRSGEYRWLLSRDRVFQRQSDGVVTQYIGVATDVTLLKEAQTSLRQQVEREQLLSEIAHHIRQTLDLNNILHTTVTEVRHLLKTDRVLIYRFNPDWSGVVIAESVASGWCSILDMEIIDTYFVKSQGQDHQAKVIKATDNIYTANLDPCHINLLEQMQVQAKLVVPILQNEHLWGLLVVQHCRSPRHWESWEIELQQQLAIQIAIAIQQSEWYQQVQTLNAGLEEQVQERTAQLRQALDFEALLKRITDRVRDSLDEAQILQTAVEELAEGLSLAACDTGIYSSEQTISTVSHEYTNALCPVQGWSFEMSTSSLADIYPYLLRGQVCQFCAIAPSPRHFNQQMASILAVPMMDDQGVLGDLWLFKSTQDIFNDQEVRLVQQVANQCAIALRQSRLYQSAQAQVQELERLNQLKDDFLSTVSHELRTPLSNIKMATQMLEIQLNRLGALADPTTPISRYFKILQTESECEINLINDLLDLTRLDTRPEPINLTIVDLRFQLVRLIEVFSQRTQQRQQQLILEIPDDVPPLITDLKYLERILSELLHNACKYTPDGETITVSLEVTTDQVGIVVSNSGIEIPATEYDRIFDKFYRIPKSDPWKYRGTGLGLALVKTLTQQLHGSIQVSSGNGQTTFRLDLPLDVQRLMSSD